MLCFFPRHCLHARPSVARSPPTSPTCMLRQQDKSSVSRQRCWRLVVQEITTAPLCLYTRCVQCKHRVGVGWGLAEVLAAANSFNERVELGRCRYCIPTGGGKTEVSSCKCKHKWPVHSSHRRWSHNQLTWADATKVHAVAPSVPRLPGGPPLQEAELQGARSCAAGAKPVWWLCLFLNYYFPLYSRFVSRMCGYLWPFVFQPSPISA